jgi:transcriptional regulator with XRE-family HTH domain
MDSAKEGTQAFILPSDEEISLHIGKRIRDRRRLSGFTQQALGDEVGVRFQQIQKYECAANRVTASRLLRLAAALKVPVQYFFDGLPNREFTTAPTAGALR